MKKFIVFAHDSRFEIVADEMSTCGDAFEFYREVEVEGISGDTSSELFAAITPSGYAHEEDADFKVFDLDGS